MEYESESMLTGLYFFLSTYPTQILFFKFWEGEKLGLKLLNSLLKLKNY